MYADLDPKHWFKGLSKCSKKQQMNNQVFLYILQQARLPEFLHPREAWKIDSPGYYNPGRCMDSLGYYNL